MAVNVTVVVALGRSTTRVEVLAEGDDALTGSPVRWANVVPRLKLEIA